MRSCGGITLWWHARWWRATSIRQAAAQLGVDYKRPSFARATFWHGTLLFDKRDESGTFFRRNRYYDPQTGPFFPGRSGWACGLGAIDHCAEDLVGWHVAKVGDRWAALEPIRQGVQHTHGGYAPKIALGLGLRADHGPQYTADQFLGELRWLGIRPSPAYVGEPECNGIMER